MSSPAIEVNQIRSIPLIVETEVQPMEAEEITGYPFDNSDGDFRSQLDDIAKRHPEFAEHLGSFRQRSNSRPTTSADDPELRTRFSRPFGGRDRFERFGFPFDDRDDFDSAKYAQQFYKQPRQEFYQQQGPHQPSSTSQEGQTFYQDPQYQESQPSQPATQSTEHSSQVPERERSNIQQSNTTDLSQRQEPVNERNQRSMSAPPVDKQQRFHSSVPLTKPTQSENMSHPQSQPETKSNERIIPIHIEGRDEPVLPRNVPPSFSQPHHQTYTTSQPGRIFGQRPEQFTQFINREPRQFADNWTEFSEEPIRQQRFQQQYNAPPHFAHPQQPKEEIPIPVQRTNQAKPQEQQHHEESTKPANPQNQPEPKPTPQHNRSASPIEQIQAIQKEVSNLMAKVEQFTGKPRDKEYLYLDEMLTRNLLKLDNIDTQGQENIRSARKEAVKCIEKTISVLESKAAASAGTPKIEETMEVEEKAQELSAEPVDEKSENQTEQIMEAQPIESQPSEIHQAMEAEVDKQLSGDAEIKEVVPESIANRSIEQQESPDMIVVKQESPENKVEPESKSTELLEQAEPRKDEDSNLSVADAVKKFVSNQENTSTGIEEKIDEREVEEIATEKQDKKKGKKKSDKKE